MPGQASRLRPAKIPKKFPKIPKKIPEGPGTCCDHVTASNSGATATKTPQLSLKWMHI
jgi:hypothetical protein